MAHVACTPRDSLHSASSLYVTPNRRGSTDNPVLRRYSIFSEEVKPLLRIRPTKRQASSSSGAGHPSVDGQLKEAVTVDQVRPPSRERRIFPPPTTAAEQLILPCPVTSLCGSPPTSPRSSQLRPPSVLTRTAAVAIHAVERVLRGPHQPRPEKAASRAGARTAPPLVETNVPCSVETAQCSGSLGSTTTSIGADGGVRGSHVLPAVAAEQDVGRLRVSTARICSPCQLELLVQLPPAAAHGLPGLAVVWRQPDQPEVLGQVALLRMPGSQQVARALRSARPGCRTRCRRRACRSGARPASLPGRAGTARAQSRS